MILPPEDAALFYKLMWALQFYVNRRLQLLPHVESLDEYATVSQDDKMEVRNALYEHGDLVDAFVAENPAHLSPTELAIVTHWKRFVSGDFYIERFLKRGAMFLSARGPTRVYAVLGLTDEPEDMFPQHSPPIVVRAVLLPFKGRIIHDGLISVYSIYFGSGMRRSLREAYMTAKQHGRIIESLEPERAAPARKRAPRRSRVDVRLVVDEIAATAGKLRGGEGALQSPAFSLLGASAHLARAAVHDPGNLDALWELERKVQRALRRFDMVLDREER